MGKAKEWGWHKKLNLNDIDKKQRQQQQQQQQLNLNDIDPEGYYLFYHKCHLYLNNIGSLFFKKIVLFTPLSHAAMLMTCEENFVITEALMLWV